MGSPLILCCNDTTDADNLAAALVLATATQAQSQSQSPADRPRIVWIMEPRQVAFGLDAANRLRDCAALIQKLAPVIHGEQPPPARWAFKTALGGLLTQADIDKIRAEKSLTRDALALLNLAVKPAYGSKQDAKLHARLTAWDQATSIAQWSQSPVQAFIDLDTLDTIQNPVNLNFHHHEELPTRDVDELDEYNVIMDLPALETREERLRSWYDGRIERMETKGAAVGVSVQDLDLERLVSDINEASSVQWFGGSSLRLLQKFIEKGVAHKIKCHIQAGSVSLLDNLFSNQFNVALNISAAKHVFENFDKFASFAVVPSHTAQRVKYHMKGLSGCGDGLGKRVLGFSFFEAPLKIATGAVTLDKYAAEAKLLADLTAILCHFVEGYGGSTVKYAEVPKETEGTDALLFENVHEEPGPGLIPMYDIAEPQKGVEGPVLDAKELLDTLKAGGKST